MAPETLVDAVLLVTLWATAISVASRPPVGHAAGGLRWYALGVGVNSVGVPLAAALLAELLRLPPDVRVGLVLWASAAGGALGLTTSRLAGGDVARALLLIVILEIGNLVLLPTWSALLLSSWVAVPVLDVTRTLVLALALPLAIGTLLRRILPSLAPGLARISGALASAGLILVMVLVVLLDVVPLLELGDPLQVLLGAVLLVTAALLAGAALGGPDRGGRRALAMVTSARSSGLALLVARAAFDGHPAVYATVVVFGLVGVLLPVGTAIVVGAQARRAAAAADADAGADAGSSAGRGPAVPADQPPGPAS